MESIITITTDNISHEHIYYVISDKEGDICISFKKAWMEDHFADNFVLRKLDARGKMFIEYIPAEKAWYPIEAPGYMHIDCFWISRRYKGKGCANRLLEECVQDAKSKGYCGPTVAASEKKRPFLSDPDCLKYKGFSAVDTATPFFALYYLPFGGNAPVPRFQDCAKRSKIEEKDTVLYYTSQCPHTDKCMPVIVNFAEERGAKISVRKIEAIKQVQSVPTPFTTYSFFYDGKSMTDKILGPAKFEKFLDQHGL